nr:hypothetical protein [Candidatus Hydrogenedentota bacterium]
MPAGTDTVRSQGFARFWFRVGRFISSHILLILFAITTLAPFLWMILTSFKPLDEIHAMNPFPTHWKFSNYSGVLTNKDISFARYYFNSLLVAAWVTFLSCLTSALAGYAFSRLRWPGRDHVF